MKDRSFRVSKFLLATFFGSIGSGAYAVDPRPPKSITAASHGLSPAIIPQDIQQRALKAGLALNSIRLEGETWVACEAGENSSCVVLGRVLTTSTAPRNRQITQLTDSDLLQFQQYGRQSQAFSVATLRQSPGSTTTIGKLIESTPGALPRLATFELNPGVEARVTVASRPESQIDTLPRYRLEAPGLVRTKDYALVKQYLDSHPAEAFMVVVTVPALCAPCRTFDQLLHDSFTASSTTASSTTASSTTASVMKTFILEYFSFEDAERELLGSGAVFPTTLVFEPRREPRQSIARFIGSSHNQSLEQLGAPVRNRLERGAPHTFTRGLLSRDLLQSLRRL